MGHSWPGPGALIGRAGSWVTDVYGRLGDAGAARMALYLGGLACFGGVQLLGGFLRAGPNRAPLATLAIFFLLLGGLGFYFLAAQADIPRLIQRWARPLFAVGFLGACWMSVYGIGQITQFGPGLAAQHHYSNDAVTNTLCATQLLLNGQNPYTAYYPMICLRDNGLGGTKTTPLRRGEFSTIALYPSHQQLIARFNRALRQNEQRPAEFESSNTYPAGAFLFPAPFMALGWADLSSFYLACYLAAFAFLAWSAARSGLPRVLLLPIIVGNISLWDSIVSGASEALDILLILVGWATWRRPWLSAILMGLAVTNRQQSWFVVIFYAVLIWRVYGARDLVRRLWVMAIIFGITNAPFALTAPRDWFDGVLGPLKDPMFPLGAGLIALPTHHWLPLWPQFVYTGLEMIGMGIALAVYWRICRRSPGTGLTLALVPLVFAWRSLFTYFEPLSMLGLWPVIDELRRRVPISAPVAESSAPALPAPVSRTTIASSPQHTLFMRRQVSQKESLSDGH